jgi:uncharacterized membrane protein YraQ (UPF0718 family)
LSAEPKIERRRRKTFDWSTAAIAALVFGSALVVLLRDGKERCLEIIVGDLSLLGAMLAKVLAGCCIGAFLAMLLPRQMVARWVGAESGFAGLLVGTIVGAILPGGPITIYPVASAFLAVGADAGSTVAFVTAWTLLGYTRALVWELPFFGPDFVVWRILISTPLPIVAGLVARLAVSAWPARAGEGP